MNVKQWSVTFVDRNLTILIGFLATIFLHNLAFFGFWCGTVILSSYLAGICCCRLVGRKWSSSFAEAVRRTELDYPFVACEAEEEEEGNIRPVLASRSVDCALDKVFCRLADRYISTWYSHISCDTWFQYEIRTAIRRIVCRVYDRICRVNVERFVLDKIMPVCLSHMINVAETEVSRCGIDASRLHVAVHSRKSEILYVQNLSKRVLRFLLPTCDSDCKSYAILLREIVSKSVFLSLSDVICNPCVLNQLIVRLLRSGEKHLVNGLYSDSQRGDVRTDADAEADADADADYEKPVYLLRNFIDHQYPINSSCKFLRPDVSSILKDKPLQVTFMRFLSYRRAEHVLQFCLDISSFNEKILKPELETEELDDLYRDAWDLYSVYFSSHSPNCIDFQKDLASPLRKALSKDILKLGSTSTLFEAYEYAFSILEKHCVDFHNSAEFYHWLYGRCDGHGLTSHEQHIMSCIGGGGGGNGDGDGDGDGDGGSVNVDIDICADMGAGSRESFGRKTMLEIGQKFNRIKEVLQTDSIHDGRVCNSKTRNQATEAKEFRSTEMGVDVQLITDSSFDKKELGGDGGGGGGGDMNKWKITIPAVGSRLDPVTNKAYEVFVIRILNQTDMVEWLVERCPSDVHSLDSKLCDYYGIERWSHFHLPSLRSQCVSVAAAAATTTTTTTQASVLASENVKLYEDYLNELIQRHELKNSEFLYNFLTDRECTENEDEFDDENEESGIGRIFRKSVAPTLRKERGQNVENFVVALMNLCVTNTSVSAPTFEPSTATAPASTTNLRNSERKCVSISREGYVLDKKTTLFQACHVYGNNFDVNANVTRQVVLNCEADVASSTSKVSCDHDRRPTLAALASTPTPTTVTPFTLLILVAYKIYGFRDELIRVLLCLKSAFGDIVDQFLVKITGSRVKEMANESNAAYFIDMVEWAIFDNEIKYDADEIRERAEHLVVATDKHWLNPVYRLIFQTLQHAKTNKQLFYRLVDVLAEELFPEIFTRKKEYALRQHSV